MSIDFSWKVGWARGLPKSQGKPCRTKNQFFLVRISSAYVSMPFGRTSEFGEVNPRTPTPRNLRQLPSLPKPPGMHRYSERPLMSVLDSLTQQINFLTHLSGLSKRRGRVHLIFLFERGFLWYSALSGSTCSRG